MPFGIFSTICLTTMNVTGQIKLKSYFAQGHLSACSYVYTFVNLTIKPVVFSYESLVGHQHTLEYRCNSVAFSKYNIGAESIILLKQTKCDHVSELLSAAKSWYSKRSLHRQQPWYWSYRINKSMMWPTRKYFKPFWIRDIKSNYVFMCYPNHPPRKVLRYRRWIIVLYEHNI